MGLFVLSKDSSLLFDMTISNFITLMKWTLSHFIFLFQQWCDNILTHMILLHMYVSTEVIPQGRSSGYLHYFQPLVIINTMVRNYLSFQMFF